MIQQIDHPALETVGFIVDEITDAEMDDLRLLCQMARVKLRAHYDANLFGIRLRVLSADGRCVDTVHDEDDLRTMDGFRRAITAALEAFRR
jgi:hypothetical protein